MKKIDSTQNPLIKRIVNLLKKSRERKEQGLFIVDGLREIREALNNNIEIVNLLYCPTIIKEEIINIEEEKKIEVSVEVFKKISYKENPDGFLVVARIKERKLGEVVLSDNPLVLILEGVEKPGNLGAILRTAYATDVDVVVLTNSQTDTHNPNVIRASEGKVFSNQVVISSNEEVKKWLEKNNIKPVITSTQAKQEYYDFDLNIPVAIVLGSEAEGLSEEWVGGGYKEVRIPMKEGIDSLNVSVSTAVILFEALRQRR